MPGTDPWWLPGAHGSRGEPEKPFRDSSIATQDSQAIRRPQRDPAYCWLTNSSGGGALFPPTLATPLVSRWEPGEMGRTSNLTLATVGSVPSSESKKMAQSLGKRSWENLNICPNNQQSLTSKKVKWVLSKAALVAYHSSIIGDSLFLCSI